MAFLLASGAATLFLIYLFCWVVFVGGTTYGIIQGHYLLALVCGGLAGFSGAGAMSHAVITWRLLDD